MEVSHKRMTRSAPPLARIHPSGLNATLWTASLCPARVFHRVPVPMSHKRTVWSTLPLASISPLGWKATLKTLAACPFMVSRRMTVAGSDGSLVRESKSTTSSVVETVEPRNTDLNAAADCGRFSTLTWRACRMASHIGPRSSTGNPSSSWGFWKRSGTDGGGVPVNAWYRVPPRQKMSV